MRCLVTGTAGFIGFHLAKRLLEQGHEVVGVDGMTAYYDVKLKENPPRPPQEAQRLFRPSLHVGRRQQAPNYL